MDLRATVLAGKDTAATTVEQVKNLCEAGRAVVNIHAPGSVKESGTASVILVLDPKDELSRAEVVQALYVKADKPETARQNAFTDVAADAEYADAVEWAVAPRVQTVQMLTDHLK